MFSFKCFVCGPRSAGDFTPNVICRIGQRYVQGVFCPYNLTKQGTYCAKIVLTDGRVAIRNTDHEVLSCISGGIEKSYLITDEIYCNGPIETSDDDCKIQNHRYCRPTIS